MIGIETVNFDAIDRITIPISIQHPAHRGLQQGGSQHKPHVVQADNRSGSGRAGTDSLAKAKLMMTQPEVKPVINNRMARTATGKFDTKNINPQPMTVRVTPS